MTYERMHSAQAQSVRVKERKLLDLLVTIVAILQEVRINVYFILISESSPYVLRYNNIIIIHAFIKRRNPTCRSKALNNDVAEVTCKANTKYVKIH